MVKFDKTGKFIKTWGKKGTGPGEIDGPHTLAMDSRGRLFLGDRPAVTPFGHDRDKGGDRGRGSRGGLHE